MPDQMKMSITLKKTRGAIVPIGTQDEVDISLSSTNSSGKGQRTVGTKENIKRISDSWGDLVRATTKLQQLATIRCTDTTGLPKRFNSRRARLEIRLGGEVIFVDLIKAKTSTNYKLLTNIIRLFPREQARRFAQSGNPDPKDGIMILEWIFSGDTFRIDKITFYNPPLLHK